MFRPWFRRCKGYKLCPVTASISCGRLPLDHDADGLKRPSAARADPVECDLAHEPLHPQGDIRLVAAEQDVALVARIDAPAPRFSDAATAGDVDEADLLARLAAVMAEALGLELAIAPERLRALEPGQRLQHVRDRLQETRILLPGSPLAPLRGLVRLFVANSRARYRPADPRPVPIALFGAGAVHPDVDCSPAEALGAERGRSSRLGIDAFLGDRSGLFPQLDSRDRVLLGAEISP